MQSFENEEGYHWRLDSNTNQTCTHTKRIHNALLMSLNVVCLFGSQIWCSAVFILASTLFSPRVSLLLFDVIFLYFNISNGFHGWVTMQAEAIGKGGQDFMLDLNMKRVYDYMYHLIMEYSKLQDFRPVPPSSAQEMCGESLLCFADPNQRKFLKNSYATPSSLPCTLPLPDRHSVERWMQKKKEIINGIEKLEKMQTGKGSI